MHSDQAIELIPLETLRSRVGDLRKDGWRLVQISATRLPELLDLTYSFDLDSRLANLRVRLSGAAARLPSISSIFWCAFLYENEIHDLFNVAIDNLAVDFKGNLYKTAVKFPFGTCKTPAPTPAPPQATAAPQIAAAAPSPPPKAAALEDHAPAAVAHC